MTAALPPLAELDDWLAAREAAVPQLRPDCEARIAWAGARGRATDWAVVYVHGFSASRREVSPYPERVADGLGANFFGARLSGHGADGAALATATLAEWRADTAEALAIGRALGRRLLVIACSTGATLVSLALAEGAAAEGAVLLSPNFGVRLRHLQAALDAPFLGHWPFRRHWAPLILRRLPDPPPAAAAAGSWTTRYPLEAYRPLGAAIRAVRRADLEAVRTPGLFAYSDDDMVVDPALSAAAMRRWGGKTSRLALRRGPGDDPRAHLLAGDALGRSQTAPLSAATLRWAREL